MKYIKRFNESKIETEIEEFCKNYLANSMDEFGYIVYSREYKDYCSIQILSDNKLNWGQIKNDFIPFIEMLKGSYELKPVYRNSYFIIDGDYYTDLNINDKKNTQSILFYIKK